MYQKITSIKQLLCLSCMGASGSEIHPFCSMEYWYSFGHAGTSSSEATVEVIQVLDLKESCVKK